MNKLIILFLVNIIVLTGCTGTMPELGIINGQLVPCPKTPNCVNSQSGNGKHFIMPLTFKGTQQQAHDHLLRTLKFEHRIKILTDLSDYIRIEFTSALFGFVDDVEFYFPKEQIDETVIHVRSASRLGYSDLGANRERIERIRSEFNKSGY